MRQVLHEGTRAPRTHAVALQIVRQEGVGALYKGLNAALARAFISGGAPSPGHPAAVAWRCLISPPPPAALARSAPGRRAPHGL